MRGASCCAGGGGWALIAEVDAKEDGGTWCMLLNTERSRGE